MIHAVTFLEFAEFLRLGGYWQPHTWYTQEAHTRLAEAAADGILRRIGFEWAQRELPVRGVSWHEAFAYARWRGTRLPYSPEMRGRTDACWCLDWYDPYNRGPDAQPGPHPSRRVVGVAGLERGIPEFKDPTIGISVLA